MDIDSAEILMTINDRFGNEITDEAHSPEVWTSARTPVRRMGGVSRTPNPLYASTHFRVKSLPPRWPPEFVIIAAYATTGQAWSDTDNAEADQNLTAELASLDLWSLRITGYSPDTGHAEPGWAVELPSEEGRRIGRRFNQDAIFVVRADALGYVSCKGHGKVTWLGAFRERLSIAPLSHPEC